MHRSNHMRIARWLAVPTFANHVIHIVLIRPQKQVIWIAARWHITSVANKHSIRYFTFEMFVGNPMCTIIWRSSASCSNDSVSKIVGRAHKYPASRKWNRNYFIKQALDNRSLGSHVSPLLPAHPLAWVSWVICLRTSSASFAAWLPVS